MNILQRYSKLKKLNQEPDLSGDRYLEHIDYIIKASTPIKNKDYFDGEKGEKGDSIRGEKGERGESIKGDRGDRGEKGDSTIGDKGERGSKFLGKIKEKNELPDIQKNNLIEGDFVYIE